MGTTSERPPRAERQAIYREKFDTEVLMLPLPLARGAALSALLKNERLMAATEALLREKHKLLLRDCGPDATPGGGLGAEAGEALIGRWLALGEMDAAALDGIHDVDGISFDD